MVSAISGSSPTSTSHAMDKITQEQLYEPGAYTVKELLGPPLVDERVSSKKSTNDGGFLGFLCKTALLAGAVCLLTGLARVHTDFSKVSVKLEDKPVSLLGQIKYYMALLGDKVDKTIVNLFQKSEKAAEEAASDITNGAKKVS